MPDKWNVFTPGGIKIGEIHPAGGDGCGTLMLFPVIIIGLFAFFVIMPIAGHIMGIIKPKAWPFAICVWVITLIAFAIHPALGLTAIWAGGLLTMAKAVN